MSSSNVFSSSKYQVLKSLKFIYTKKLPMYMFSYLLFHGLESSLESLLMCLVFTLVVSSSLSLTSSSSSLFISSSPFWREFVHEFENHALHKERSETLKLWLTPYSLGSSNWYALLFILFRTWKGTTPLSKSLDFLWFGNIYLSK